MIVALVRLPVCFVQPRDRGIVYRLQPETYLYLFLVCLVSAATVVHLIYGTLVLFSSTFIDTMMRYS